VTDWLLIMYSILLRQLFFVAAVVYSGSWDFLYGRCKQLFVGELNNAYFSRHLFQNSVWVTKSCITVCFTYSLRIAIFWTQIFHKVGCGGVFKHDFVTNFLLSLTAKEFRKFINNWRSYWQEFGVLFSDSQCSFVCCQHFDTLHSSDSCRLYIYDNIPRLSKCYN